MKNTKYLPTSAMCLIPRKRTFIVNSFLLFSLLKLRLQVISIPILFPFLRTKKMTKILSNAKLSLDFLRKMLQKGRNTLYTEVIKKRERKKKEDI